MKEKVIVVLGPTATGKSDLALWLAESLQTEIISGDSMLVYQGFDIGTAKPGPDELAKIKHHLIDIVEPDIAYSAATFQKEARQLITKLNLQGKIPIVAGGTGLYLRALLEGYEFSEIKENPGLRQELETVAESQGGQALYERLQELSPEIAKEIHPNNERKVIRALEVALAGSDISRQKESQLVYDAYIIGLTGARERVYRKINSRVEKMFAQGLVEEVKRLLALGFSTRSPAMQGIGYKEVVRYLEGELNLTQCKDLVAKNTRHFAKRQFTWYKKMPYICWYDIFSYPNQEVLHKDISRELEQWQKVE